MDIEKLFQDNENIDIHKMLSEMGLDLNELETEFENFSNKKELKYEVINENTTKPQYNYESDSGFDLHSTEDILVEPFGRVLVPTGLRFDIPDGTEIQVRPKSGLALKQGLTVLNTPGTVDCGYNGEVKVIVFNTNNSVFEIKKGMKIAQAVLCPVINGKWVKLTQVDSIDNKERGDNGFGSTGI